MLLYVQQAVKRLLTFMQRAYPTDPSRSIDFDAIKDPGRGAAGGGSDKQVVTTSATYLIITSYLCLPVQLIKN